ncbi:unnamed protein product [Prorocentrum cordatum]|uniref:Uncharacterized protein n=1 Tax=Prorocentrum cordatum TaxID=2364126 RepID=A0ABN9TU99_9DINO|nr:unnamed protein product [Polarella glacialis]
MRPARAAFAPRGFAFRPTRPCPSMAWPGERRPRSAGLTKRLASADAAEALLRGRLQDLEGALELRAARLCSPARARAGLLHHEAAVMQAELVEEEARSARLRQLLRARRAAAAAELREPRGAADGDGGAEIQALRLRVAAQRAEAEALRERLAAAARERAAVDEAEVCLLLAAKRSEVSLRALRAQVAASEDRGARLAALVAESVPLPFAEALKELCASASASAEPERVVRGAVATMLSEEVPITFTNRKCYTEPVQVVRSSGQCADMSQDCV